MTRLKLKIIRITDPAGQQVRTRRITLKQVGKTISRVLIDNVLCSMASVSAEGRAYINTAYFCYSPELELFFISHPDAYHCQNILSNPSMAIAIFSSNQDWVGADCGLQLFGTCKQVSGREASKAGRLYGDRFAEYRAWKYSLDLDSPGRDYQFYKFATTELKVFDEKELGAGIFVRAKVQRHTRSG